MKNNKSFLIYFFIFIFISSSLDMNSQTSKKLSSDIIELIYDSVYEVVIKKPFDNPYTKEKKIKEKREAEIKEDPIIYEEELPWDILPYSYRIDEYYSIGTAFAVSEDNFISASHVVGLDENTLFEDMYLRDKNGNIFEIDQIIKYSNYRDFVLFKTKSKTTSKYLKTNTNYQLNTQVFAVGNAFGEGIVIRDGLLTSLTKESGGGEWSWIRFSAAASPGNSGGPLLNENGEVIGIVLRKSKDENLNYALPILEVFNAKENTASYHRFSNYNLIITTKKYGPEKFDKEIKLPLDYKELRKENLKLNIEFSLYLKDKLMEKYKDVIFPNGSGSLNLMHSTPSVYFPHLACENENDGKWDLYRPNDIKQAQLENNGYLKYGMLSYIGFFEFKKPDNIAIKDLFENSKLFMDIFLKGYPLLNRGFGDKQIRISSLGDSFEKAEFIDRYKRKWIVETWLLEYINSKLIVFSLPTPIGRIGMYFIGDVQYSDYYKIDLEEYTNYIYYSYSGVFNQWKDFFQNGKYLPETFKSYKFLYNENKMTFNSSNFSLSYEKDLFKISDQSYMILKNNYYKDENKKVIWDIIGIAIWENKNDKNYFSLLRSVKPEKDLPDNFYTEWSDLVKRKYPYDREAHIDGSVTFINDLHNEFSSLNNYDKELLNKLYSVELSLEGKIEDKKMKEKFNLLDTSITIHEQAISSKQGVLRH